MDKQSMGSAESAAFERAYGVGSAANQAQSNQSSAPDQHLRLQALQLANDQGRTPSQVVDRAVAYLGFLKGID